MNMRHPQPPTSGLAHCLRQTTRHAHHRLDHHALLAPLVRPGLSRQDYGRALASLHGSQAALESAVRQTLPDMAEAFPGRLALLEADLTALGLQAVPRQVSLPTPGDAAEAVAYLYLLEGSSLGGAVIGRQVALSLPDVPRHFFAEEADSGRWGRFWSRAEALCPPDSHSRAAEAAMTGYAFIHTHLDHCLACFGLLADD